MPRSLLPCLAFALSLPPVYYSFLKPQLNQHLVCAAHSDLPSHVCPSQAFVLISHLRDVQAHHAHASLVRTEPADGAETEAKDVQLKSQFHPLISPRSMWPGDRPGSGGGVTGDRVSAVSSLPPPETGQVSRSLRASLVFQLDVIIQQGPQNKQTQLCSTQRGSGEKKWPH